MIDSQPPWETVKDMEQFHGTGKASERQPVIIRDSERHVETPSDRRKNERQTATIGDSERHATTRDKIDSWKNLATIEDSERHAAITRDSERHAETPGHR